jgi:hypothetical protein
MQDQKVVDRIRIASPCQARWEDMDGDDRARFCGQCRKHVYNFSAMTRAEVETLIREKEGRLCGRFYQRSDGRMLTADCPTGAQRRRSRLARLSGSVFAAILFFLGGRALLRSQETNKSPNPQPTPGVSNPRALMGDVAVAPVKMGEVAVTPPKMGQVAVPQPLMGRICVPPPANTNAPVPAPPKDNEKNKGL